MYTTVYEKFVCRLDSISGRRPSKTSWPEWLDPDTSGWTDSPCRQWSAETWCTGHVYQTSWCNAQNVAQFSRSLRCTTRRSPKKYDYFECEATRYITHFYMKIPLRIKNLPNNSLYSSVGLSSSKKYQSSVRKCDHLLLWKKLLFSSCFFLPNIF